MEINPTFAEAYANHGVVLLLSNTALQTAEELFTKACKFKELLDASQKNEAECESIIFPLERGPLSFPWKYGHDDKKYGCLENT